jgi:cell division protein FtsW
LTGVIVVAGLALYLGPEYRIERIMSMYDDVWNDPYGRNYQITQSLIALGNGRLTGMGFGSGVQKLFYLPEAHTDFIFAVWTEELGALGAITLLAGFGLLIVEIIRIAIRAMACGHAFSMFYAYGLASLIALQVFINVGVNMRLLPITGMTLPFISYGGSSLLILMMSIAVLLRIEHELCHSADEPPRRNT